MAFACCSSVLTGTKRMLGRCAASQMDASFSDGSTPSPWHADVVRGRPPHHVARRVPNIARRPFGLGKHPHRDAASVFYGIASNGGTLAYQKLAPTRAEADKLLDDRLAAPFTADANDTLYQWDPSRDYNPSPGLEHIQTALLAINSADDERNPPETGIMDRELKRVTNGSYGQKLVTG